MKKEHWLYLVIAILAIWIIASYMSQSRVSPVLEDTEIAVEEGNFKEIGMPIQGLEGNTVSEIVIKAGASAGPNKGTVVSTATPSLAKLNVLDQLAGSMVSVGVVEMPVNGWVVVHEERDGGPGNILGAQRFDAGSYTGGQVELLRTTTIGGKYYVMLHSDNGDKLFDHKLDLPLGSESGTVVAAFVAK